MSIEYIPPVKASRVAFVFFIPHYATVSLMELFVSLDETLTGLGPPSFYSPMYGRLVLLQFVYCIKSIECEAFTFLFWTVPMDLWTWVLLSFSCLLLTAQLRGDWFQVYSILMRQSCTLLERHKILIIFIFATIIFTYGYEGVVSSFLTIPPPFEVFKTLNDLLRANYTLAGVSETTRNPNFLVALERENISTTPENIAKIVLHGNVFLPNSKIKKKVAEIESATLQPNRITYYYRYSIEDRYDVKCHTVKHFVMSQQLYSILFGETHKLVVKILQRIEEAGMASNIHDLVIHLRRCAWSASINKALKKENDVVPFKMSDWKILSIFIVCGLLKCVAIQVFGFEILGMTVVRRVGFDMHTFASSISSLHPFNAIRYFRLNISFKCQKILNNLRLFFSHNSSRRNFCSRTPG